MAYIDKDLLLQDIEESVVFSVREGKPSPEIRGARKIVDRIENDPTVEVVEVVRCKDCQKCKVCYPLKAKGKQAEKGYYCKLDGRYVAPSAYCSYGERRDT